METYEDEIQSKIFLDINNNLSLTINILFIFEIIIKSIDKGLLLTKDAYLNNNFNRLDIVLISITTASEISQNIDF